MTHGKSKGRDGNLSALIRDQLRDATNRKLLSRMPVFRPDTDTHDVFSDLLAKLDRAEAAKR